MTEIEVIKKEIADLSRLNQETQEICNETEKELRYEEMKISNLESLMAKAKMYGALSGTQIHTPEALREIAEYLLIYADNARGADHAD